MTDLVIMNHGGGIQTSTLGEMIVVGEIEKPNLVIFADTGDEPTYVYRQVEYMQRRLATVGVPLVIVANGNMHDDLYGGKRFAAMPLFTKQKHGRRGKRQKRSKHQMAMFDLGEFEVEEPTVIAGFGLEAQLITVGKMKRQCTHEYKIVPIERKLRALLLEMGLADQSIDKNGVKRIRVRRGVLVESWLGYTMDEVERIKPAPHTWQEFRYPLIEKRMTLGSCIQWLQGRNLPIPLSSNCRKCPLISDRRISEMKQHDPEGYKNRVQFDRDLRNGNLRISATAKGELFLHQSCKPLDEVKLRPEQPSLLGCINHCMT